MSTLSVRSSLLFVVRNQRPMPHPIIPKAILIEKNAPLSPPSPSFDDDDDNASRHHSNLTANQYIQASYI
ncbi:hypothetical protein DERP_002708 [Dermatophagoides pteronyssinus]|uniref:Uncharacterized protein n=1 Tax=Dermatophagoides pteronyssinus TaxID=6956 RepID=A0ABQ8JVE9_DERPT|nr:hypothetical protein DERP_002708 [Dermatophagoides pteronyssinus]